MSKVINITVPCPRCCSKFAASIHESDVGTNKQVVCPKCHNSILIRIPPSWINKFSGGAGGGDATVIGDTGGELSLLLETVPNPNTEYQSYELTADYYTIGRKSTCGPEYRADFEVVTSDLKMSRKHMAITRKGKIGFTVKDLGSKNGVKIIRNEGTKSELCLKNGDEFYLKDGDTICLGQTLFRVTITHQGFDADELTRS